MVAISRKHPHAASAAAPAAPATEPRPPDKRQKALPDNTPLLPDKPGAGRTTRQGRRTETPALTSTPGPSGQRGKTQQNKRHTNK